MQTDALVHTSKLSINNHIFKIYLDNLTNYFYINLTAYSQSINLIGIYPTLQQALDKIDKLSKII